MELRLQNADHTLLFCDVLQEWLDGEASATAVPSTSLPSENDDTSSPFSSSSGPLAAKKINITQYLIDNGLEACVIKELSGIASSATKRGQNDTSVVITTSQMQTAMLALARDAKNHSADMR